MEVGVVDNTLILSGPVVSGDLARVKSALEAHPGIDHAVLRNSWGGDAWSGFHLGELTVQRRELPGKFLHLRIGIGGLQFPERERDFRL